MRGVLRLRIPEGRFGPAAARDQAEIGAAEQLIKRNLVIFVTARLVNPGGQLVNSTEEIEESEDVIEPPILPEVPFYKK